MKGKEFWFEVAAGAVCVIGGALMIAGAVLLSIDNAMFDYYNQSNRQAVGWMLCFVPAILAIAAYALYFLRRKLAILEYAGVLLMVLAAILPFIYMVMYQAFTTYIFNILIFIAWILISVVAEAGLLFTAYKLGQAKGK